MAGFLQIVLGVVVALAGGGMIAWWWLKRRFRRAFGDYAAAADLVDPGLTMPARLRLYRADLAQAGGEFGALKQQILDLGFRRMGEFRDEGEGYLALLAARHETLPVAAAVMEEASGAVSFVLFAVGPDQTVVGRGGGPGPSLDDALLDWQVDADLAPDAALEALQAALPADAVPMDLSVFRSAVERAYAARMDQAIVHQPTRAAIERRAGANPAVTEEQVETAYQIVLGHWKSQIEEAVLDRYRRSSRIDAVAWEEMRDSVQVVHSRIDDEDVADLLVADEVSERIYDQCRAQGLHGVELYQEIARQVPANRHWSQIGVVERPVRALLFAPNPDADAEAPSARSFVYEAQDDSGASVHGAVFAVDGRDAKRQIRNLGLRNARLLIEPVSSAGLDENVLLDEKSVAIAARSVQESIAASVLRTVIDNWWIWAPPAAMAGISFKEGAPFTWLDYAGFAWAAAAAIAMVFSLGPMIAYNQLLLARLRARSRQARISLAILGALDLFGSMSKTQLLSERCKNLSQEGRLDEALALWAGHRPDVSEDEYLSTLASIYDLAGDYPAVIEAQRAYLAKTQARDMAAVDLAMSMARFCDDAGEAETLLQSVSPGDLSELALAGYQYVRGLLAARRGDYQQALRHYAQSTATASQFASVPIVLGLIAEINGYAALALKRSGERHRAEDLWQKVVPILKLHRSADRLVAAYESGRAASDADLS